MMLRAPAAVLHHPAQQEDPVLAAVLRAPLDEVAESEEERRAVQAAKASGQLISHAQVEAVLEARSQDG
jgi:tellurite resistance protein